MDLINWLTSPGGNLIWDVVVQAAGIFLTVFIIERWLEKREEKRWLPLKHRTYILLIMITRSLIFDLLPHKPSESQKSLYYYFGNRAVISSVPKDFGNELLALENASFVSRAKELIKQHPKPLEIYQNYKEFRGVIDHVQLS